METQVGVRKAVWSRYWSNGVGHSCGGSYGENYEGALAQFWRSAFAGFPIGARVLDVATGNGAVPRLLLASVSDPGMSCDAIDLAQPEPQWIGQLAPQVRQRIRFHGQQAAESLAFPDDYFDAVLSQYGLEYTDLSRSVPEILRVLRPGGKVCLLAHHADARPVQLAHAEVSHLDWIERPDGLLEAARAMIEPMSRAATEAGRASLSRDGAAMAARDRFNALQVETTRVASNSQCPDVLVETRLALAEVLKQAGTRGIAAAEQVYDALLLHLADSRVRLRELIDFALDEPAAHALCAKFVGTHGAATLSPVVDKGVLMGWGFVLHPA